MLSGISRTNHGAWVHGYVRLHTKNSKSGIIDHTVHALDQNVLILRLHSMPMYNKLSLARGNAERILNLQYTYAIR